MYYKKDFEKNPIIEQTFFSCIKPAQCYHLFYFKKMNGYNLTFSERLFPGEICLI